MYNVLKWDDNHQPLTYNQVGPRNQNHKILIFTRNLKENGRRKFIILGH